MSKLHATPFILILLGFLFVAFPTALLRRKDEDSALVGFLGAIFGGLVSFIPERRQLIAARVMGIGLIFFGAWLFALLYDGPQSHTTLELAAPASAAVSDETSEKDSPVAQPTIADTVTELESPRPVAPGLDAAEIENEKAEIIAVAESSADEVAAEPEIAQAEADPLEDSIAEVVEEPSSEPAAEIEESLLGTPQAKPQIPDEPSPFMDNSPKKPAPKATKPTAGKKQSNSVPGQEKGAVKQSGIPRTAAPSDVRAPEKALPKAAEEEMAAPPEEASPRKLAEADELIRKAKMMWELEEFEASVKLAEKARAIRTSQLGENDEKVAEVDRMLKAARAKIPDSR